MSRFHFAPACRSYVCCSRMSMIDVAGGLCGSCSKQGGGGRVRVSAAGGGEFGGGKCLGGLVLESRISGRAAGVSAWECGAGPSHRSLRLLAGPLASATSAARINRGCFCLRLHFGCKDTTKNRFVKSFGEKFFKKMHFSSPH